MNILLSGYYGFNNAGDELILESIVTELRAKQSDVQITVLSVNPEKTASLFDVCAVNRWKWWQVIGAVRECDVLLSGGGGLFQDRTGNLSLYYYLAILFLGRLFGKKIFICSVGINELKRLNRYFTVRALAWAEKITVREAFSRDLLLRWGCPPEKIEITADPVLLKETRTNVPHPQRPRIAFILRPPRRGKWPAEIFVNLADSLSQRLQAQIIFVPFHIETDLPFTLSVMRGLRSSSRLVQWNNTAELYEAFSEFDLVISQRLHGLILGALHGLPLVGFSEDPKIDRFLRELGQKNITRLSETAPYSLLAVILDVWEWREEFRKSACQLLPSFKVRARRMSDLLFESLSGR
ncbi:MAG: polysaccharide pyruvyl transferase CsaB [Endomicrobiales bacterium]